MIFTIFQSSNISIFCSDAQSSTISLQFLHVSLLRRYSGTDGRKISDILKCDEKFNQSLLKSHISMTVMTPACGGMMGSAANGSWQNYWMVCEHVHITTLFLKRLKQMVNFF
jgi:hypothetical protein